MDGQLKSQSHQTHRDINMLNMESKPCEEIYMYKVNV